MCMCDATLIVGKRRARNRQWFTYQPWYKCSQRRRRDDRPRLFRYVYYVQQLSRLIIRQSTICWFVFDWRCLRVSLLSWRLKSLDWSLTADFFFSFFFKEISMLPSKLKCSSNYEFRFYISNISSLAMAIINNTRITCYSTIWKIDKRKIRIPYVFYTSEKNSSWSINKIMILAEIVARRYKCPALNDKKSPSGKNRKLYY